MKSARLSVELRTGNGSVGFQSTVPYREESLRHIRKELKPGESMTVDIHASTSTIALLAIQSRFPASVIIDDESTSLEGSGTGDFGLLYCRRGLESVGFEPWPNGLQTLDKLTILNGDSRMNRIDLLFADGESLPPAE